MFAPFSSFPVPHARPGPRADHLMDWLGWRGPEFCEDPQEPAPEPQKDRPEPGRH